MRIINERLPKKAMKRDAKMLKCKNWRSADRDASWWRIVKA
jgi:hypothetical protein